ncbi:MAG: NAD(P)/FAD-dependent oxidoreductase [Bacteroidales bacterium]
MPEVEELRADVAVVGAGPAGSLAALVLARAGIDVALVDRASFPRDKACGDGLMPDAMNALRDVGLDGPVLADARRHDTLRIYSPNGTAVDIRGQFAVVPRARLDSALCEAATMAGARLLAPVRVLRPLEQEGRVVGVAGQARDGAAITLRAPVTVLATGAGSGPLQAFDVCERTQPSATAVRFYVTVDAGADVDPGCLCVSYERRICPGYGWVFPGPGGTYNIGAGYFYDAPALPDVTNLRVLLDRFVEAFAPARTVVRAAVRSTPLFGAPLRTGLTGARLSRPGLLVVGDAAGLTYSISGEGIGKAMESGILAARVICERGAAGPAVVAEEYELRLRARLAARFRAYAGAQRWVAHPRLVDFLAWRAHRGTYVRRQIEGLVNETTDPRGILSVAGILRSVFS